MNALKHNAWYSVCCLFAALIVSPAAYSSPRPAMLTGVNLAGAEFSSKKRPGTLHRDYVYPATKDMAYFLDLGMNVFRLPFRWERLQHRLRSPLIAPELQQIDKVVDYLTAAGAYVVLDLHNYARYNGEVIGSPTVGGGALEDVWRRLARHYRRNERVIFGLMGEPFGIGAPAWRDIVETTIAGIRSTGATNLILVPGVLWTGAHSWTKGKPNTSNGDVFASLTDPGNNFAFEVHQYLDKGNSGTSTECVSKDIGSRRLASFTAWLRKHNHRGFLGEFGVAPNSTCLTALDDMLDHIDTNADMWLGWTYWAAGAWWGDYPMSIHPVDGITKPQTQVLMNHGTP